MPQQNTSYFNQLSDSFGQGWNRFWFLPSDPLPLSVVRLLAGLMLIYLHVTFWPDLNEFFGVGGLLPEQIVNDMTPTIISNEMQGGAASLSYLSYLHSSRDLLIAHSIGLVVLVAFTAGLFTRLTSILTFLIVSAYYHRAPMLATQTELVLSMVALYLCIGRSGAYLSIDSMLARRRGDDMTVKPTTSSTLSIRLIQVHFALLIAIMGLSKIMGESWWDGKGIWWLLARPESRMFELAWLPEFAIDFWTHLQVAFELSFPLLVWNRLARPLLLVWGFVMWSLLCLATGNIPLSLTMILTSLAFVPASTLAAMCPGVCGVAEERAAASAA